jgi:hypothetical protein
VSFQNASIATFVRNVEQDFLAHLAATYPATEAADASRATLLWASIRIRPILLHRKRGNRSVSVA